MNSNPKRGRALRVLGGIGTLALTTSVFIVAIVLAILVHLDLAAPRRLIVAYVNGILQGALAGDLRIEHIGGLSLRGFEDARIRVRDAEGVEVLRADGVRVRVQLLSTAHSVLFGKRPVDVALRAASVEDAHVVLDPNEAGALRLSNAFQPRATARESGAPAAATPAAGTAAGTSGARPVRVHLPDVRFGHVWGHGTPKGLPLLDFDVFDLAGRVDTAPAGAPVVRVRVDHARLVTRALPRGADLGGMLSGTLAVPASSGRGIDLRALYDGAIAGAVATVEAMVDDRRLDARLDVHDPTGEHASRVVGAFDFRGPISAMLEAHGELPRIDAHAKLALGAATVAARAVVVVAPALRVNAVVSARQVDLRSVIEGGPRTRLGIDANATMAVEGGDLRIDAFVETLPSTIEGVPIPRVEAIGRFSGDEARVRAQVHEAGMPTEIAVDLSRRSDRDGAHELTANVRSVVADVRRVPKLGSALAGSAMIDASARVWLPEQSLQDSEVHVVLW
ncbi:MAG TPA: hypothetical protein VM580_16720, partial [Labilithrix sp.]|nr:hypothetical protein [Labilithrix sp.]